MFKSFCCYSTESSNSISNQNAKLISKNKKSSEAALDKQKVVELNDERKCNNQTPSNNTTNSNNGTNTTKQTNSTIDTNSTSVSTLGHTNSIHFYHPKSIPNNMHNQKHTNSITIASVTSSSSNYQQIGSEFYHEPIRVEPLYQQDSLLKSSKTSPTSMSSANELKELITRLESVTERLERTETKLSNMKFSGASVQNGVSGSGAAADEPLPPSIEAFDALLVDKLQPFISNSRQIGGDVKTVSEHVEKLFTLERAFLVEATKSTQPPMDVLQKALQPLSKIIEEIQSFKDKNRKSEFFNHLSAISESIGALGWITVSPAPSPYIKEMSDAGQFYTNRVLKDFKEKENGKLHTSWVQSWLQLLSELQAHVKEFHTRGVSYNVKGKAFDASKVLTGSSSAAAAAAVPPPSAGGAPPPPPPPIPSFNELFADTGSSKPAGADIQAALKAELNKGTDITKGLRKVTDDQKTHKNTALRAGNTVPGGNAKETTGAKPASAAVNKPPKLELIDKKWVVEYQVGQTGLVIDDTEIKQSVYIYQCRDTTIQIKGKVNSIILDSCTRCGVLFDDVLSTLEFINSKSVQAQVNGKVPTVSIDKTDGVQVYLNENTLDTEIVSAKSSSMNILIPSGEAGDYTEHPIPEQYKTTFNNKKFVTVPTESA